MSDATSFSGVENISGGLSSKVIRLDDLDDAPPLASLLTSVEKKLDDGENQKRRKVVSSCRLYYANTDSAVSYTPESIGSADSACPSKDETDL